MTSKRYYDLRETNDYSYNLRKTIDCSYDLRKLQLSIAMI